MTLPAGKLPPELLAAFLAGLPEPEPRVIVGAAIGEDAAVLDMGDRYLALAADPVTLSARPGSFAVQINANDIAVMGAEPRWLLATVLLPLGSTETEARDIMDDLLDACTGLGVALIGGHTEISPSVTQPVIAATMAGEVAPERLVRSSGARAGDALLLAGPIAVEGTAILAAEYGDVLRARGVMDPVVEKGQSLLREPGISVLPAARLVIGAALPHAMHDPTEGGLLSAVREIAVASKVGVRLEVDQVPVLPACRTICSALDLDPLALLASGGLLVAMPSQDVSATLQALAAAGLESAVIGEILPQDEGMWMHHNGANEPLPSVQQDELARWIEQSQSG